MKKNPLGCRTVWLNSSTTRWTTGRKLRIHTQQKTQAGIDSVRTQLLVHGTSPLPKGATRWQNMKRKPEMLLYLFLFLKEEHPWFYFPPSLFLAQVSSSSAGFFFLRQEKASTVTPFVPLLPAESNLGEKIFSCCFLGFWWGGTMLTCNQSPVNPARGRKKTIV